MDKGKIGNLVKHSIHPEWGTGIIRDSRTQLRRDPAGDDGYNVIQYKVWFSVAGEGWHDAMALLWLPTDIAPSAP